MYLEMEGQLQDGVNYFLKRKFLHSGNFQKHLILNQKYEESESTGLHCIHFVISNLVRVQTGIPNFIQVMFLFSSKRS